jgi:phosphatidylinositol glycan class W
MASLKEQKEAFVSGLDGTTPQELLLICSTVPIGLWLFQFLPADTRWKAVLAEAVSFWIPMILCQTNYLYPWGTGYLGMQVLAASVCEIVRAVSTSTATSLPNKVPTKDDNGTDNNFLGYLAVYRAALMYLTFVAILAVDFHVFPRRFVKTEETGYSLMDLGAASFVVAAGLVSSRARGSRSTSKKQQQKQTQKNTLYKHAARMLPLVFMGSLRLVTHKELEYQEHVSEYGVHWNFFYTMAMLVPVAAVLPGPGWILPTVMATAYQYALSARGLQEWVLQAPRSCALEYSDSLLCNLFVANREGVLGCIGYGALYLMSEWIGYRFVWNDGSSSSWTRRHGLLACAGGLVVLWQLLIIWTEIPVSRRTTNTIFTVWALVVNVLQLAAIRYAWMRGGKVPSVLVAVNRHGLLTFILANLLTGAVNLLINTLEVSDSVALVVLFGYVSVVGSLAVLMDVVTNSVQSIRQSNQKED